MTQTFQCPEGRYSSALLPKEEKMESPIHGFSAPKGVIAVRYGSGRGVESGDGEFQCPEGRYSSALPSGRVQLSIPSSSFSAPKGVIAVRYCCMIVL